MKKTTTITQADLSKVPLEFIEATSKDTLIDIGIIEKLDLREIPSTRKALDISKLSWLGKLAMYMAPRVFRSMLEYEESYTYLETGHRYIFTPLNGGSPNLDCPSFSYAFNHAKSYFGPDISYIENDGGRLLTTIQSKRGYNSITYRIPALGLETSARISDEIYNSLFED